MGIKRVIIFLLLLIGICVTCYSQEYVKIKKDYYTNEYDDDKTLNNCEYFGWSAFAGATESQAVWKIMKITYSGNDFIIQWANGNQDFSNKWEERATLTYQ